MKEAWGRMLAAWAALLLLQTSPAAALQDGALPERAEPRASPSGGDVLEVPYLPQSEALCGGAAVAMVMRYWGERDIYAEDFAAYVSDEARGIPTESLARAAERSGWSAVAFNAGSGDVEHHLSRGRPLIALIEVAPERFHYVVIVGRTGEGVLYHDPAVGPYRVLSRERFERAWSGPGHWAMLLLRDTSRAQGQDASAPAAGRGGTVRGRPSGAGSRATGDSDLDGDASCDALVTRAIESAGSGELEVAERLLVRANETCGASPAVVRELAGSCSRQPAFGRASGRRLWRRGTGSAPRASTWSTSGGFDARAIGWWPTGSGSRRGIRSGRRRCGGPSGAPPRCPRCVLPPFVIGRFPMAR
jgi:hypothetical protein